MNHPQADPVDEIEWMAAMGLEFLDLTLEPPGAPSWEVKPREIRAALERHDMPAVGHTAFYLPLASPFEEIRRGCVEELTRCLHVFAEVGAKWMNVHPDRIAPMQDRAFCIAKNLETLRALLPVSKQTGVGMMIENIPGQFNNAEQMADLLEAMPELGMHLDIGHCNLHVEENTFEELMHAYGHRLQHVHLHDNKGGGADLHLPLGAGTVPVEKSVRLLKAAGYDGPITLEVFTPDREYLRYSARELRRMWDETGV